MYLDPLVSLCFSSFELVILLHIYHILFRSCRTNLVSRSHVTLLTQGSKLKINKQRVCSIIVTAKP